MTAKEIRKLFFEFFESKQHTIVPSAPMVVKNDPTLMFTNAGMNQFKDLFLGNSEIVNSRIADTQKCLRVSGKHNDLEEVGHDSYHHTMFEMLGNWSFGDYFKNEAIDWAWELLTKVYGLDPERLYATVFEGSKDDNLGRDTEAETRWLKYLPADRIISGNKKDNFWEMGDTGPCGPCSEIHIDLRSDEERAQIPGAELVNKGHHLVIEIWNLVFMQFNRKANGSLEPLPAKHVDTGMGLERLCMALQGKQSNYDTDIFQNLIQAISRLCGKKYEETPEIGIAMRVIADHLRAISFSIADGQLPSNVKAGYVIRRILRRAVRYAYTFLDVREAFLCRLVPDLIKEMGDVFPELIAQQPLIEKVMREEEEAFLRTLEKGIKLMDSVMEKNTDSKIIPGVDAFTLYDTFGFPIDLTELIAKENGYTVDIPAFEVELGKQKQRSRNASAKEEGDWTVLDHECLNSEFTGYDHLEEDIHIVKYRTVKTKNKTAVHIVFNKSPFYAESGGQVGDNGYILGADGEKLNVINTIKENNLNIHICNALPADTEQPFKAVVNAERRAAIANNHSATHLLHYALRQTLGTHIEQKGSLVSDTYFRFDFSHFEKISSEDLRKVERIVNSLIRQNIAKEENRAMPIEEARKLGAMALFGEKYGDKVRVIRFGESVEFCGGTHVERTGDIGMFKIVSESAVAAGVRRIEATTGAAAEKMFEGMEDALNAMKAMLNNSADLAAAIKKVLAENEEFKKEMQAVQKERATNTKNRLMNEGKEINGINVVTLNGIYDPNVVKDIAFMLKSEMKNTAFTAAFTFNGKPYLSVMFTEDLVARGAHAGKVVKEAAKLIQGGGGGQAFFASAGGKNMDHIAEASAELIRLATEL